MEEENKIIENELNNTDSKISEWLNNGKSLMFPERFEEWESCVEARANGMYNGKDLDIALEIIEKLDKGATLWEARQFFEAQEHSQGLHAMVSQIVFAFSKQGPEFLEYIMDGDVAPDTQKAIDAKKRENLKLSLIYNRANSTENNAEDNLNVQESVEKITNTIENTTDASNIEEEPTDPNKYLQVKKENIFSKIVTFIRRVFFSRKYKDNFSTDK